MLNNYVQLVVVLFFTTYYLQQAAAVAGVVAGLLIKPGSNVTDFAKLANWYWKSCKFSFIDNVVSWFPTNIVHSMDTANMLQIIVFCVFLGVAMLALGDRVASIAKIFD